MNKKVFNFPILILLLITWSCSASQEGDSAASAEETTTETASQDPVQQSPLSPLENKTVTVGELNITIQYSSPAVRERVVWGDLVPYNKVWRTGANEATWIELSQDVTVNGEALPAGKYSVFTIPTESTWTVIFNSNWEQYGAFDYEENKEKDVLTLVITPNMVEESAERMSFDLAEDGEVKFMWEKLRFSLDISPSVS